jgi:hypothetical protein
VLAAAGTYTGTTLAAPAQAPAAAPPYTCPTGGPITVKPAGCDYLKELNAAFPGMVPIAAYVNASTICLGLRATTPDKYAVDWQRTHPAFTITQAEEFIKITQADIPSGCYW